MKSYSDLKGDGGSNVMGQVLAARAQIKENLSQIRYRIAIASGKGGVGKSTLTWQLALRLKKEGYSVSCLDADLNGPSLAKLAGLEKGMLIPGEKGLVVPKTRSGIGVVSLGSVIPESEAIEFESVATGESHVWRATKEFTTLAQFLATTDWGVLDFLLIDLPPGAERVFQFAEFLGKETSFILVTIPSEVSYGVVQRSLAALKKANANILGWIENMSGYYCEGCREVRPLFLNGGEGKFDIPCLGKIPFDPSLARGIEETTREILKTLERKAA